jgi:PIN domain nuclease of toxin-antitoxin system
LDTHVFLWFIQGSQNLSETARNLIEDQGNQKLLSIASLWEMSIKVSIGKLDVGMTIAELVSHEVHGNGFEVSSH